MNAVVTHLTSKLRAIYNHSAKRTTVTYILLRPF